MKYTFVGKYKNVWRELQARHQGRQGTRAQTDKMNGLHRDPPTVCTSPRQTMPGLLRHDAQNR